MVTPHPARATLAQGVWFLQAIIVSKLAVVGIGKHRFHLHGRDRSGRQLFRKKLSCQQMMRFFSRVPTRMVMETCAGAHFVARGPCN